MKYYKLCMDFKRKNDIVGHYYNDYGIGQNQLNSGIFYENWDQRFSFYFDKTEGEIASDYLANDKGWFVVSEKLKNLLAVLNTEIQFLPVKVREKNSEEIHNYFIANILSVLDALCLEKSDYFETEISGRDKIYTVSKFAVYEKIIEGVDVFKLANRQEIPIFVSQRFKLMVEKNSITGIGFYEIKVV